MKKLISISLAITTTLWLVGTIFVPFAAKAAVIDGDIVSPDATFVDADGNTYYPYDVFIVKIVGTKTFKRLVLNPQVFTSYAHLKWANLKKISAATVKGYTTSALVRAVNDPKVYVLAPNGDTGTKKWVDDIPCFTSKGYDWDSVYEINATDRDNYTTVSSLCGGVGEVTGDISLALASDNPVAATLPLQSQGIAFLKVNVTGSGTISQLTIARKGAGQVDDFGDVYVYKNGIRLTAGRALSSATSKVSFINLGIAAPATFEVVADLTGTPNAGNVNYFAIEAASDVTANATIGGAFPLNGNPMGTSGATAGTLTVDHTGSATRDVTIGTIGAEISQFKLTTATEGAYLSRVKLLNNGDADNDKVTNLVLKDNLGTTLATYASLTTAGYVDFVLSTPYYIKKGESQIFRVYADIGATKPARTIKLYPEITTDILATGNIYGFGMKATLNFATGDLTTVTCKGGDLTLNKIGPNAAKIGTTTYDTNFLEFSMSAAADITIKRTRLVFCEDLAGDGSYNTASVSAGADIEDIKIKDKDSGVVIAGPKDGTAFNDNTYAGCPSAVAGMYEDYTDTIDLTSGTTKTYQVTADIKTSNTDSGMEILSGSKIKFVLYSYATIATSYGVAAVKYADTSEAVLATAIAPSGDIAGEEMTVGASALTLSLAATPSGSGASAKTYIKGQAGVEAVGIIFTAGNASDVTVSNITLTAYTSEDVLATRLFSAGVDTNYVKDTIGNVYIYDKTTGAMIPGSTAKGFSGASSSLVEYSGLNWVIPAGEQKTLLVKSDISSASPASASDGTADTFISFNIVSDNVSAIDKDGNTVAPSGYSANGSATVPTTYFGVAKFGSLAMVAASDTPDKSIAVMGTTDNEVSKFKLTGTNEAWYIEKFSIVLSDGQADGNSQYADSANTDNFSAVKIKYQTQAQAGTSNWTISSGKTFGSTASLAFSFGTGSDRLYVPKDNSTYVSVLASIATYNGGNGAKSKVPFKMYPITGSTDSFLAYGAQSGEQLYTVIEPASTGFNLHFVARSKPVFAKEAWSGGELELARFSITAVGYDVIFDGDDDASYLASAALSFDVIASASAGTSSGILTLYDWSENIVASTTAITWGNGSSTTRANFTFEVRDTTVPQDTTKVFHVDLAASDLSDFIKQDEYLYLQLKNDKGANLATSGWTGDADEQATNSFASGYQNVVYHDGSNMEGISAAKSSPEKRFGMPSLIKNIGSFPFTFRTLRGTATAP
jgi:hypothetical protein